MLSLFLRYAADFNFNLQLDFIRSTTQQQPSHKLLFLPVSLMGWLLITCRKKSYNVIYLHTQSHTEALLNIHAYSNLRVVSSEKVAVAVEMVVKTFLSKLYLHGRSEGKRKNVVRLTKYYYNEEGNKW